MCDHCDDHSHTVEVGRHILAHNDGQAQENRRWFDDRHIRVVNLLSSPGAGKTLLLERTLEALQGRLACAVVVGDLQTDRDARRLMGKGALVQQIETITACHLDARQVFNALPQVIRDDTRLLFIENVGNLVCPAAFDLGEHRRVALLSVPEGEDKPLKYPLLFRAADVVLLTKIDLIPHLSWNHELFLSALHTVNPDAPLLEVSAVSGNGMHYWLDWLMAL